MILRSPWDFKVEVLQWWSTQDWSGSFPTYYGAAAFFLSALPIVLWKNRLHQHLYAFMTSTSTTLEILSQSIISHKNKSDVQYLNNLIFGQVSHAFQFSSPFLSIFNPSFLTFFSKLFLVFILLFSCQNLSQKNGHGIRCSAPFL